MKFIILNFLIVREEVIEEMNISWLLDMWKCISLFYHETSAVNSFHKQNKIIPCNYTREYVHWMLFINILITWHTTHYYSQLYSTMVSFSLLLLHRTKPFTLSSRFSSTTDSFTNFTGNIVIFLVLSSI